MLFLHCKDLLFRFQVKISSEYLPTPSVITQGAFTIGPLGLLMHISEPHLGPREADTGGVGHVCPRVLMSSHVILTKSQVQEHWRTSTPPPFHSPPSVLNHMIPPVWPQMIGRGKNTWSKLGQLVFFPSKFEIGIYRDLLTL